mmetsp:Transcript_6364/g.18301  ORF Transcript_6364/g.18301 Transcript_6364/m.18301 type:complete len:186 (-) Transcript_6364:150-707(-)
MSIRRLVGLQSTLAALAGRCAAAQARQTATSNATISAAPAALRLAAASLLADHNGLWRQGRSFAAQTAEESEPTELTLTEAAVERLEALAAQAPGEAPPVLRLTVEGGGCSGFTYTFDLDKAPAPDDRVITKGPATLVCDNVSYEFIRGATIDYTTELVRSSFEVTANPNAEQSCGCGSSFAPKS